ncbi:hypothetical protein [Desulfopila aestuarii]|uniref:Apea-like HEPN domain-containing protein n=1 Tax=Desulfopila aestuarii DSM 18488 TaxID=1121416 RepID=A0A1M7YAM5_9BACT|nr:hypothetical protein [Desulfopila aestuarii]SHO49657.1 hypothetical protein SAMN02745220_02980 [Desulfopila aestuarii DSM 18488]
MNNKDTSHWNSEKLSPGFHFCIQRLDELLFDYTIDSYKPRALNAPSLCIELLKVIEEVDKGNIDRNNVKYIIEELKQVFKKDKSAKELTALDINYFLGLKEDSPLSELKLKVSVLERSLERGRYIKKIQEKLQSAIEKNNKDEIDILISTYITTLINRGISKQFIYHQFNKIFFNGNIKVESDNSLWELFKTMNPKRHVYSAFFKVSKSILLLEKSFNYFGIRIADVAEERTKELLEKHNFKAKDGHIIVEVRGLKLPDPFFARDFAEKRLETIRNTSNLFFHNSKLRWNKRSLVKQHCCSKDSLVASNQINPMRKSFNHKSNDVALLTNQVFENISLQSDSFKKFNRVLELHSNCLQNLTPENQLVNLWIILETLIPSVYKKSKVENICIEITPLILMRYFRKLCLELYHDIIRWNSDALHELSDDIATDVDTHFSKFLLLLSDDQFHPKLTTLYGKFDNFHLLRNRVFKISSILKDKSKIQQKLENHKSNITWQVRRVYRTRNLIVHSGTSPNYINVLVENTHYYIDQILSEIVDMTTSTFKIYNLEQAFEFGKILYSDLERRLNESKKPNDYIFDLTRERKI